MCKIEVHTAAVLAESNSTVITAWDNGRLAGLLRVLDFRLWQAVCLYRYVIYEYKSEKALCAGRKDMTQNGNM